jgi:hypothetical protein
MRVEKKACVRFGDNLPRLAFFKGPYLCFDLLVLDVQLLKGKILVSLKLIQFLRKVFRNLQRFGILFPLSNDGNSKNHLLESGEDREVILALELVNSIEVLLHLHDQVDPEIS